MMVIVIMNLFIFEKPAPRFFSSEPILLPHSQEANIVSLCEWKTRKSHGEADQVGGWLSPKYCCNSILCFSKIQLHYYMSWVFTTTACSNFKSWDQNCQGFIIPVHQQTHFVRMLFIFICSFSNYFLNTYWEIISRPKFKFMGPQGHGNSLFSSEVQF